MPYAASDWSGNFVGGGGWLGGWWYQPITRSSMSTQHKLIRIKLTLDLVIPSLPGLEERYRRLAGTLAGRMELLGTTRTGTKVENILMFFR